MDPKPEQTDQHSPRMLKLAAMTLKNPKASDDAKALAASILGGPPHEANPTASKRVR